MSTNTIDRSTIPDENDVQGKNMSRWRIADGKFKKGREKDDSLETREPNKIVGVITAFRVFCGEGDKGPYEQLEVDVQARHGMEYIKVSKNMDKGYWPTQGVGLAKFMCAVIPGRVYMIEPQLAAKDNSYGTRNTFVDVALWNEEKGRTEGVQTSWDGQKFSEISDAVFEALRQHPLYKDREAPKREDDKTEFDWFLEMIEAKGWPDWQGNEVAYVEALNSELLKAGNGAIAPEQMDEDYFNFARQAWDGLAECPLNAKPSAPKGLMKPATKEGRDPFKDE